MTVKYYSNSGLQNIISFDELYYELYYPLLSVDIDECVTEATICGPDADCENSIGAHTCICHLGYELTSPDSIASVFNPCHGL